MDNGDLMGFHGIYPLVNVQTIQITMENHHVEWENSPFLWTCSIVWLNMVKLPEGRPY